MTHNWPDSLPVAQVRIARPTDKLPVIKQFYCEGLGLQELGTFEGHNGYDGLLLGLPGSNYHLEFTQHENGSPCPAPSKDNLLVLYIPDSESIKVITDRLARMGYASAAPENPYWLEKGAITIPDPDGWRLVLMPTSGIGTT